MLTQISAELAIVAPSGFCKAVVAISTARPVRGGGRSLYKSNIQAREVWEDKVSVHHLRGFLADAKKR